MTASGAAPAASPTDRRARRWLLAGVLAFVAVTAVFSELRFLALHATAWDLGIYQQALWSTAHGRPFYEAMDLETGGFGTFLQVHSAFVLYAVVPLYSALPQPVVLFLLQSVVVGMAALPLYLLARGRLGSPRPAAAVALLYLAWTPTVAGTVHDFHIEAFVPLVFLASAYLWSTGRYRLGLVAVGAGMLTMEVVPGLLVGLALFLLAERLRDERALPRSVGAFHRWLRELWRDRASRYALGLLAGAIVSYYVLLLVRLDLLPTLLGTPPYPTAAPPGYVTGETSVALGLSPAYLAIGSTAKLSYWLLILGLVGFLPFFAPRSLLLLAPGFLFSLFSWNVNFTVMGFQYGLLYAGPVFVAVVAGAPAALRWWQRTSATRRLGPLARVRPAHRPTAVLLLFLAVNVAISPLNPWLYNPPSGYDYALGSDLTPGASSAFAIASLVPAGATVVASDDLFPLVANNVHAYSLFWHANAQLGLPFGLQNHPQFALLAEAQESAAPPWLTAGLYDPGVFGVRAVGWGTPVGTVLLFEAGFHGSPQVWGAAPAATQSLDPGALRPVTGAALLYPGAGGGSELRSQPGVTGLLWDGPGIGLAPGTYRVTFEIATVVNGGSAPPSNDGVLTLAADEFAQPSWFVASYTYGELGEGALTTVSVAFSVPAPTISVNLPAYLLDPNVGLRLVAIEITPL